MPVPQRRYEVVLADRPPRTGDDRGVVTVMVHDAVDVGAVAIGHRVERQKDVPRGARSARRRHRAD